MKNNQPSNKSAYIIGIIVIAVIAGGWYFYEQGKSSPSTSAVVSTTPGVAVGTNGAVGSSVLSILNSVSSIHIDDSLFTTPAYQSLVDYSITVPPEPVGRNNPFSPTAATAASAAAAAAALSVPAAHK